MPGVEGTRPNFVFVFMDDMGYADMGCYGPTVIKTPVMDSVAERGVRFERMYSAAPICSPSRCAFLTGRYAQRAGVERVLFPEDTDGFSASEVTIADCLKNAGYASACIGKWHVGCRPEHLPTRHGFDRYYGLLYSNDMSPLRLWRDEEELGGEVDQDRLIEDYTAEAIKFVKQNRDRPFFVYLAHTMPHIPLHVSDRFRGRSAGGLYGDTIEAVDACLGELLEELRRLGLADRTLVMVSSDNGPWFEGATGVLRGRKFDSYEGGVRMPFVAALPGLIEPRTVARGPASLMDLFPTMAALAGAALPEGRALDGADIREMFAGGPAPERDLYFYYHYVPTAVMRGRWKLHVQTRDGDRKEMPQLFDVEADPGESYNLAGREPDLAAELASKIERFDAGIRAAPTRRGAKRG